MGDDVVGFDVDWRESFMFDMEAWRESEAWGEFNDVCDESRDDARGGVCDDVCDDVILAVECAFVPASFPKFPLFPVFNDARDDEKEDVKEDIIFDAIAADESSALDKKARLFLLCKFCAKTSFGVCVAAAAAASAAAVAAAFSAASASAAAAAAASLFVVGPGTSVVYTTRNLAATSTLGTRA